MGNLTPAEKWDIIKQALACWIRNGRDDQIDERYAIVETLTLELQTALEAYYAARSTRT